MENKINSDHYRKGSIEVIDFIQDQQLDFCLGNVIKYICRAGHKTKDPTSDLLKAKDYIEFAITASIQDHPLVPESCLAKPLRDYPCSVKFD